VLGAEVWVKLVEPNGQMTNGQMTKSEDEPRTLDAIARAIGDPSTFGFLTMTTRPTFRADFKLDEGGKKALYMARWINTRGEKGPWSEICSATVAA